MSELTASDVSRAFVTLKKLENLERKIEIHAIDESLVSMGIPVTDADGHKLKVVYVINSPTNSGEGFASSLLANLNKFIPGCAVNSASKAFNFNASDYRGVTFRRSELMPDETK